MPPVPSRARGGRSSVLPLEQRRDTLPDADAHRHQAIVGLASLHFVKQGGGKPRARAAERVSQRDGAPVYVYPRRIESSSRMQASDWAANASFSSTRSTSSMDSPVRSRRRRVAGIGPMPMYSGSTPITADWT